MIAVHVSMDALDIEAPVLVIWRHRDQTGRRACQVGFAFRCESAWGRVRRVIVIPDVLLSSVALDVGKRRKSAYMTVVSKPVSNESSGLDVGVPIGNVLLAVDVDDGAMDAGRFDTEASALASMLDQLFGWYGFVVASPLLCLEVEVLARRLKKDKDSTFLAQSADRSFVRH